MNIMSALVVWTWTVGRSHGYRCELHRALVGQIQMDRICRSLLILYVAVEMIYRGLEEVWPLFANVATRV